MLKLKDDKKLRDYYEEAKKLRNKIRTHLRNEYPDQYKTMGHNERSSTRRKSRVT